jgi:serine protease Do
MNLFTQSFKSLFMGAALSASALAAQAQASFADVVEKADPAVVSIRTVERISQEQIEKLKRAQNPFQFFFEQDPRNPNPNSPNTPRSPQRQQPADPKTEKGQPKDDDEEIDKGIGSGFIISSDGYLLTNHHVIRGADVIYVTLLDKREFKAKLIGSDARTDVALLKIEAPNLAVLPIGNTDKLRKGDWVIAIGSPLGLESTVTKGIVSAKGRDTGSFVAFLQTDVPINGGNSGGPLINDKGEVVGINSRLISRTGGYQGISLAIPIDEAMRVSDQLRKNGKVSRGIIGVVPGEVSKDDAEALGLAKAQGAAVLRMVKGLPAEKAGFRLGDIILKFNGKTIDKYTEFPRLAGATLPGSTATLEVWRAGKTMTVTLVMGEAPADDAPATGESKADDPSKNKPAEKAKPVVNKLGITFIELPKEVREKLQVPNGVLIDKAEGAADRAGLAKGDVIVAIGQQEANDPVQANTLIDKVDAGKQIALLVKRGEQAVWVVVRSPAK